VGHDRFEPPPGTRFVAPVDRLDAAVAGLRGGPAADADALASLRTRLVDGWSEPHRHYHSLQHLVECLDLLDDPQVHRAVDRVHEVELGIWLHDLVYDPQRHDNEERSADAARRLLAAIGGIPADAIARIAALVMATKLHVAATLDEAVLLDIDLAILAAPPARFAEYEAQIRREYAFVDDARYLAARRAVLTGFLARPQLYHSDVLHERCEARARANLAAATR
jgi:predicted metal-dependent HD superfamily phosphohydrolase